MAYVAKCDTAIATKWWITGTGSSVNRLSEVMDDNPSGVEEDNNPGNYQPWSTFLTEHIEDADYQVHLSFDVGDGGTATTLTSIREHVYFDDDVDFTIKNNATLQIGDDEGSYGWKGSYWNIHLSGSSTKVISNGASNANFKVYNSLVYNRASSAVQFEGGNITIKSSILEGDYFSSYSSNNRWDFRSTIDSLVLDRFMYSNMYGLALSRQPDTFNEPHIHKCNRGIYNNQNNLVLTVSKPKFTDCSTDVYSWAAVGNPRPVIVIDPVHMISNVEIAGTDETNYIEVQYSNNQKIVDKDGTAINGATVTLDGSDVANYDTEAFSVDTAADGTITEQTVTVKKWEGTNETLTDYNNFRLTIEEPGYETLTMEGITIDSLVNWCFELQDEVVYPGESDVRIGVEYGDGGNEFTGSLMDSPLVLTISDSDQQLELSIAEDNETLLLEFEDGNLEISIAEDNEPLALDISDGDYSITVEV